ncbi:MAG TPA: glycosyltransferase family protein [Caulobacteraceae bacterium]|jgi:spore coat polysaccharide biosynthesis protein SpsF|nr:glycosyltransferase family protein [Caulobacteraceae bacterium]
MILAVLQARMSSTRLPGKVMKPLLGVPMILRQLERLRRTRMLDALVVATSDDPSDDPLAHRLQGEGVATHRGSLNDVLDRFAGAVAAFGPAEHVVRLTADCPLADPEVIDACVRLHVEGGFDYTANDHPSTFPRGLDVEVMTAQALRVAASEAADPAEREHVTMFLYRRPERFSIGRLVGAEDLSRLRWTVDTPADFAFVERVYARLYPDKPDFTSDDIRALDFERTEEDASAGR